MEIRSSWGGEALLDKYYPIGRIYQSTENVSPASFMGGSWERIEDVFLLCAGSTYAAGTTGGEANVTLTVEQMPPHNHETRCYNDETSPESGNEWVPVAHRNTEENVVGVETFDRGGGQAHNNLPPYLAIYCWRRVA